MVAQDRRMTLQLMAEELGISKDTVHTVIREDLYIIKLQYKETTPCGQPIVISLQYVRMPLVW